MSALGDKLRHFAVRLRNVHLFMSRELDDVAAEADRAIDGDREEAEKTLRRLLWLRHDPEHFNALYGDDGQMNCNACMIDFKRNAPEDIERRFVQIGRLSVEIISADRPD